MLKREGLSFSQFSYHFRKFGVGYDFLLRKDDGQLPQYVVKVRVKFADCLYDKLEAVSLMEEPSRKSSSARRWRSSASHRRAALPFCFRKYFRSVSTETPQSLASVETDQLACRAKSDQSWILANRVFMI